MSRFPIVSHCALRGSYSRTTLPPFERFTIGQRTSIPHVPRRYHRLLTAAATV